MKNLKGFPQSCNKSLINQACSGPYWENISPRSFLYGPRCARSVLSRPRADILPVRPSRLVNKIYISNKPGWNNCFIKNNHQISLKSCHVLFRKIFSWTTKRFSSAAIVSLRGKKFQNFSCCADAYTYHICRAWYNGSY